MSNLLFNLLILFMSFVTFRDLFVGLCFIVFLLLPRLIIGSDIPYWLIGILVNGIPLGLVLLHKWGVRKYQQTLDNFAYIPSMMCIAVLTTLGSFSKEELIEFGFKFLLTESSWPYFVLKLSFFFWILTLLPVVLDKFFNKNQK